MGWWPFGGNESNQQGKVKTSSESPSTTGENKKQPVFLEDVPPKFTEDQLLKAEDAKKRQAARLPESGKPYSTAGEVKRYVKTLSWDDFKPSNLLQIPCFRDAGLSGFSCMFVFASVLFLYHRDIRKCVNWGYGGLLLGSVFGWEHCNRIRKHSQQVVKLAQERYQEKQKKKNAAAIESTKKSN